MLTNTVILLLAAATFAAAPAAPQAASPSQSSGGSAAVIPHCQVFLIHDVQLAAKEAGPIVALNVGEGDRVEAGQILAKIDDRQAQFDRLAAELKRDAALEKSEDDIEVRYAQAALGVADAELEQNRNINRRSPGTVSEAEMRRLKLTRQKAQLQIDRSRLERRVARLTADMETTSVAAAEERIRRRQLVAPFDGLVLDIASKKAEWVDSGAPVLRIIRLDRLRVEGFLDVEAFNPEDVAQTPVTVTIRRARGEVVELPGQVTFVSPLVQAGNKYRVRAQVTNRLSGDHWLLRPGMSASMSIHVHARSPASERRTAEASRLRRQ